MALHVPPTCPVCDSTDVRKSRRRNFLEKLQIIISCVLTAAMNVATGCGDSAENRPGLI